MDPKEFGRRMRKHRKNNNMTQLEFAEKMGISPQYLGAVERGERDLSLLRFRHICKEMGLVLTDREMESKPTRAEVDCWLNECPPEKWSTVAQNYPKPDQPLSDNQIEKRENHYMFYRSLIHTADQVDG
jgi:transcriptional regulator with XRE-family HTH domain